MMYLKKFTFVAVVSYLCVNTLFLFAGGRELPDLYSSSIPFITDTIPLKDREGDFTEGKNNPFDLDDPKVIDQKIEYDPVSGEYKVTEKIGNDYYRPASNLTFTEFLNYKARKHDEEYFKNLAGTSTGKRSYEGFIDPISKIDLKRNLSDRLFGGLGIEIKPSGSIELLMGANYYYSDNPQVILENKGNWNPDFDMIIQMEVTGNIGDKLKLNTNYNTEATFDFENKLKLNYDSEKFSEDDIIKKIEAGNVSLPLRTNLIQGSQNLFGFKTDWQFGHLRLSGIIAQQKSKQEDIQIKGGGVVQTFQIRPDEYDENRHFFISHFNRESYEDALANLPEINSQFKLKSIEVWLTEDQQNSRETEFRDIVAITDLGATKIEEFDMGDDGDRFLPGIDAKAGKSDMRLLPTNDANKIYNQLILYDEARDLNKVVRFLSDPNGLNLKQGRDFEKVRAKRLSANEYSYNADLGFISLRVRPRPNQVLAVAYQYIYNGREKDPRNGVVYKVGELTSEVKSDSLNYKVVFVKMLKSSTQSTSLPSFDLMMKNVYPTGGFNLNPDDFQFDIYYEDQDLKPKRYIEEIEGFPLLNLFRLDNLNKANDAQPDGTFDFVPGQTVIPNSGAVIFPVLEPFGKSLKKLLAPYFLNDPIGLEAVYDKYDYPELYDTSITSAQRNLQSNQFTMRGSYKSGKSNEIPLNTFNLDPNAQVVVKAGSQILREGSDYTVDRGLGRVTILNETLLESGVPIKVEFEDNALFSFQTKTMLGFRAEYVKRKDVSVGATYMHLFEKPFTQKVNIGEDPINNRIYGLDFNINKKAPWLTRALDKLPLYSTKEASSFTLQAEAALLDPGHSKAINQSGSQGGAVYIDDFEGSSSGIGLAYNVTQWMPASAPTGLPDSTFLDFLGADKINNTIANANRALLSWYRIDPSARIDAANSNSPYTKIIDETDVFPKRFRPQGFSQEITFDITYFPEERGSYNYELPNGIGLNNYSTAGMSPDGKLLRPETRWAGLMTRLNTNDFEASNVEYIDFWMLNPFINSTDPEGGKLYFQVGTFSEDIYRDGKQQFENGLPTNNSRLPVDNSVWGVISRVPPLTNSFDVTEREKQDVGFDGLNSKNPDLPNVESSFFKDYVSTMTNFLSDPEDKRDVALDPSNDDYISYRDTKFATDNASVIERYKKYNMPEGNAQLQQNSTEATSYTGYPDQEDLNFDKSLNELESYYHYEVPLKKSASNTIEFDPLDEKNLITEKKEVTPQEVWYHFRIPIANYQKKVGSQNDFRSIQSMRILFSGFKEQTTFRFIKLQLGRNTWRTYKTSCTDSGNSSDNSLVLDKVDIEENEKKEPFIYIEPPGIEREKFFSNTFTDVPQNESSLLLKIDDLLPNCDLSIYKIIDLDIRRYKRLKMFVHGESIKSPDVKEVCIYMKLCKDFEDNYYEYEIPLKYSNPAFNENRDSIWLDANSFDFPLQLLVDLKNKRNAANAPLDQPFEMNDPDPLRSQNKIRIKGNPTLGLVRAIQIGVRNKSTQIVQDAEIWINELRLTGLEEKGGFASQARAELQLADLGNIAVSGNYSTVGWGGIDQKLEERAIEDLLQLDATTSLAVDKFLPKKLGLRLPFTAQVSHATATPEFDPIDTDLRLKDKIANASSKSIKDSIRDQSITRSDIQSFGFNNVRKERSGNAKAKPWNIENIALSYSQSVAVKSDPIIRMDKLKINQGSIDYNFSWQPKYIEPFKKIVKAPYLKFISEINFNPLPNSFSVRNNLDRRSGVKEYRFADARYSRWEDIKFSWLRDYSLNWDFTKNLKMNFSAKNDAVVDEMTYNPLRQSHVNPQTNQNAMASERKSFVRKNISNFGRNKDYKHTINLSYNLPFRLIPYLDFITSRAQYTANYGWSSGSIRTIDTLGSIINNGQNISLSGEFNLSTLYNKSRYLKRISGEGGSGSVNRFKPSVKEKPSDKTEEKDKDGKKAKKEKKDVVPKTTIAEKILIRPLLLLKRVQLNYSQNKSSTIPGFMNRSEILGMDKGFTSPGWDFVTGFQPNFKEGGWLDKAAARGWISPNCFFNKEMSQQNSNTFSAKVRVEPFKEFNVDINVDRGFTKDVTETFKLDSLEGTQAFQHFTPVENGQYTISYISIQTLFDRDINGLFDRFSAARAVISKRLAGRYGVSNLSPGDPTYYDGFRGDHTDVVAPAFLAAYTNKSAETQDLNFLNTFPLPNWQINYNGLSKLRGFKNLFQDFSLRHSYKNTMTVNNFRSNLDYNENSNELPISRKGNDLKASFHSRYEVPQMVINEQFSPLLGINIKTKNGIELGLDYNKTRNLTLQSGLDGQLRESNSTNYTIKAGYIIRNVYLPFIPGVKKLPKKITSKKKKKKEDIQETVEKPKGNDLEFTFDFGLRDDITLIHRLDQNSGGQVSNGSKQYSANAAVKYNINKNLNARLYFDYNKTLPYQSAVSSKDIRLNGGIAIQFVLN